MEMVTQMSTCSSSLVRHVASSLECVPKQQQQPMSTSRSSASRVGADSKMIQSVKRIDIRCGAYPEGNKDRKAWPRRTSVYARNVGDSPTNSPISSSWKLDKKPFRDALITSDWTRETIVAKGAVPAATKASVFPSAIIEASKAAHQFRFHTEGGGQLKATVDMATASTYCVEIQVDEPETSESLALHWGLFRSDSTDWVLLGPGSAPPNTNFFMGRNEAMRTPLQSVSSRQKTLKLEFGVEKAPFYVHFVLYQPAGPNVSERWIRNSTGGNFCVPVGIGKGRPEPLGPTWNKARAVNFALFSKNAEGVILCLYNDDDVEPSMEIDLDPFIHRTGDVWHVELQDIGGFTRYGYRCKGEVSWESGNRFQARNVLLDPYAKLLAPFVPGQDKLPSVATVLGWLKAESVPFDWEGVTFPQIPLECLFAYRLNVGGFTSDESSGLDESIRGTFDGLVHKCQHLVNIGVNAVILEPIFSHNGNFLNPFSFFTPAVQYGAGDSFSACTSLKRMVKQLHKFGVEVILEVVFSHTAEGGDESPKTVSFRGIDNSTFYILNEFGRVVKSTVGTENTFNCNHPFVQTMIVDSLRYWVEEFHVDGFLFLNGSALVTGPHGEDLSRPPLIEAISFDPILASTKLIVNSSSPFTGVSKMQNLYLVQRTSTDRIPLSVISCFAFLTLNILLLPSNIASQFLQSFTFPHWKRWCEWNNCFRDDIRRFMRGDLNQLSNFATRLCGSGDLFASGRGPNNSFNFVTSSYGLTLADLVTYRAWLLVHGCQDAEADLECVDSGPHSDNTQWHAWHSCSWNSGAEGPSNEDVVLETRVKQVRNFIMALLLSEGVPVLNMGDEYGHSKGGSITLDESSSQFLWNYVDTDFGEQIRGFISSLVAFRSHHKNLFQRKQFAELESITWHGVDSLVPTWDEQDSPFLGAHFHAEKPDGKSGTKIGDVYIAFNAHQQAVMATLPDAPKGMTWYRVADTSLPHPNEFVRDGVPINMIEGKSTYEFQPNSSVVLEVRKSFLGSKGNSTLQFPATKRPKQPLS